jgi:anaerobic magnesium-protoporphyrin IX monomethyl ester cyclase
MKYDCVLCNVPFLASGIIPNLAIGILSGILKANDYKTKVFDFNRSILKEIGLDEFNKIITADIKSVNSNDSIKQILNNYIDLILECDPKVLCFTAHSNREIPALLYITKKIKENHNIKIVIGGLGASHFINPIYNYIKEFDISLIDHIVIGLGENIILKFMGNEKLDHIIYNIDYDMSMLTLPDYSDLNLDEYNNEKKLSMYTSIGCPNNCSFCEISKLWPVYKQKPIDNIIKEIKHYKKEYGTKIIIFMDNLINANFSKLQLLCKEIKELDLKWTAFWSISKKFEESIVPYLKDSGCISLRIGIESGSESVRKRMHKYFSNENIFKNLDMFHKYGIEFELFLIGGYPEETEEEFNETLNFIDELDKRYQNDAKVILHPLLIVNENLKKFNTQEFHSYTVDKTNEIADHLNTKNITTRPVHFKYFKTLKVENNEYKNQS